MMQALQNLWVDRGDDVDFVISFFEDNFEESPIDVSNFVSARFSIREKWNEVPFFVASVGTGIDWLDGNAAALSLAKTLTSTLSTQKAYPYDVEVVTFAGKTHTTQRGYITIGAN